MVLRIQVGTAVFLQIQHEYDNNILCLQGALLMFCTSIFSAVCNLDYILAKIICQFLKYFLVVYKNGHP